VRFAALPAALAVAVMLGFCGWALAIPAAVAVAVGWRTRAARRHHAALTARPGRCAVPEPGELAASR
jgi:hypothetical protein